MIRPDCPFGFRVVGPVTEPRRLVDATAAFSAYAACDPRAEPEREGYLSAFRFGRDFGDHLDRVGSPKGYAGACGSPWLWFDIDRKDDLDAAQADARRLVGFALDRYRTLDDDDVLTFFSGAKGFHVGVPLAHGPEPSPSFHATCRRLAEALAKAAGVRIDSGVYDRVRCFRAPNSRHPKTGRHKRPLSHGELMNLTAARVVELAAGPRPFDVPAVGGADPDMAADWRAAADIVGKRQAERAERGGRDAGGRLQRATLDFIRDGATEGERTTRLFRAAANLREFDAPPKLVLALLSEAALDSGLPPAEVERVVGNGIDHTDRQRGTPRAEGGVA